MGACDPQQVQNGHGAGIGRGGGDEFVSDKGWWPKSALPGCFLQFPSPLIGSAPLISWCLCGAVMRAGLKPSILGQWLCAGDLGSGRGRGAGAGRLPPKSNVEPVLRQPLLHPTQRGYVSPRPQSAPSPWTWSVPVKEAHCPFEMCSPERITLQ